MAVESQHQTGSSEAPGPRGLPLLGSLGLRRDVLGTLHRAMLEYGDVVRFIVGPPGRLRVQLLGLFHPEAIQHVLAGASGEYLKDTPVYREIRTTLGNGLLTSEGEVWRRQKRLIQPLFTHRRVASHVPLMADEADRVVEQWRPSARGDGTVDLHADMTRVTLNVVGQALFGGDVDHMVPVLRDVFPFLSERVIKRGVPRPIPATWPTPGNRRAKRARRALYGLDDLIARRRRAPGGGQDLLGLLLDAQDPEGGTGLSDEEVRDQALIFLLAGHETTATSLTFALHLLGRHPEVRRRLHEEVDEVLGERMPTLEDVRALGYTTMVVKEAMRLYPAAYAIGRLAPPEGDTIDGYEVPRGSVVLVSPWVTHRHPAFWDEPERFEPERFTPEREAARHRYAYFPFAGGPRACIGSYFSMLEAVVVVALLMRSYDLTTPPEPIPLFTGITLRPRSAVPARITPR